MHVQTLDRSMPFPKATWDLLGRIGELLGRDVCWLYQRRFHFALELDGWTLAVSPESAGRFRLEACRWTRPVLTLWVLEDDGDRLEATVRELCESGGVRVGA